VAPEGKLVEEGEVVARFDPTDMEERLRKGRSELASATLRVDKSEIEGDVKLAELDTDYRVAGLEVEHAERFRKVDDTVFSRHDIIEDQIDEKLAGERREHAVSAKERQRDLGHTDVELLAIQQRKAQLTIDQAEQGLQALEVRSPHAGLLTLIRGWRGDPPQVGSEMWSGQEIAEIPDLSKMEAEVFVLEADAGGLEVGKPATVIVEADPGTVHPAKIRRVDTVAKPRFRGSPVQYFGVTLELEETDPATMKPGQRVRATLILAELGGALVVPRQAVAQEDGRSRVFVRRRGGFEPREVSIGASSMGLMVVTEGLEEGDVIALRPPEGGGPAGGEPGS
jgi:RND family efflux transporter MFP subunit